MKNYMNDHQSPTHKHLAMNKLQLSILFLNDIGHSQSRERVLLLKPDIDKYIDILTGAG